MSTNQTKTENLRQMLDNGSQNYRQLLEIVEDHAKQLKEMRTKLVRISSSCLVIGNNIIYSKSILNRNRLKKVQ